MQPGGGAQDRPKADPPGATTPKGEPKDEDRPEKEQRPYPDMPKAATPKDAPKDEGRPEKERPQGEDLLSPQELTDRLLVVRARLDKPGEVPEYELGEPIIVNLDIRNMSDRHLFNVPNWGVERDATPRRKTGPIANWMGSGPWPLDSAMCYVVEARRYGKPIPLTTLGRQSVESLQRNHPVVANVVYPFDDGWTHRRVQNAHTDQPTPAHVIVNVLCDMTDGGDYELVVKFLVGVLVPANDWFEPVNTLKVVNSPPLRLSVVNRLYKLEPPPVKPAPRSN
ncbi:MAG: hypothetical protein NVSMB9_23230 [Isosphaeraceae bacterium]